MSHKYKGIFFAIASASLFGLSPLWVTTFTSGGGNSMMMAFIRNLFFLPVCALLLHRREGRVFMPVSKAAARGLVILSLFGSGMTQLLLFASYSFMASGICTTVHFIYPLFVFLMSAIFYGQKMTPKTVFCLALADAICLPQYVYSAYAHADCPKQLMMYPFTPHCIPDDFRMLAYQEFSKL